MSYSFARTFYRPKPKPLVLKAGTLWNLVSQKEKGGSYLADWKKYEEGGKEFFVRYHGETEHDGVASSRIVVLQGPGGETYAYPYYQELGKHAEYNGLYDDHDAEDEIELHSTVSVVKTQVVWVDPEGDEVSWNQK